MPGTEPPNFDRIDGTLRRIGAADGAAEAHGCLCGLACLLGTAAAAAWVATTARGSDPGDARVLGTLAASTCTALAEGDMSFMPLLPPDDRPLADRATGLAQWCAGFMHGLGEAAGQHGAGQALAGEMTGEVIADFSEIARVALDDDESELEAETAYAELVEFVRVSVQLVFEEQQAVRARAAGMH
jgi:uncharacterized protein YgfB (UPF0149 family)